jgi:ubiquinone/menaquinone biosynthesis C-methylase UbiE
MDKITAEELNAQLYDVTTEPDWKGEIDFYRGLITHSYGGTSFGVLELACGTGRVTVQLARDGINITGLDVSPEMLEVARRKSTELPNVNWVLGDMRTFELRRKFGYVISPGHSFQFMTTPDDQVKCLEQIKKHLIPDGLVVIHIDHQDISWLADLIGKRESASFIGRIKIHPVTGEKFRQTNVWSYEPDAQTATCQNNWEKVDESGNIVQTWKREPMRFHCVFRFEMEHLLRRVGFSIEAVYGDFDKSDLTDGSTQMIWIAKN